MQVLDYKLLKIRNCTLNQNGARIMQYLKLSTLFWKVIITKRKLSEKLKNGTEISFGWAAFKFLIKTIFST